MLCRLTQNKKVFIGLILVGAVSCIFGWVAHTTLPEDAHSLNMLMGMFTGAGAAFVAIGAVMLIRLAVISPGKLKLKQIEQSDERNVQITKSACAVAAMAATILFAVMAFVFVGLGYPVPSYIAMGGMYVQLLVLAIARRYYSRKM